MHANALPCVGIAVESFVSNNARRSQQSNIHRAMIKSMHDPVLVFSHGNLPVKPRQRIIRYFGPNAVEGLTCRLSADGAHAAVN
eukprot:scaffold230226_cov23-Prasinocladus_malaysianus.AAC.1